VELKYRTAPAALDTENEGRLKAAFSVFDELDSDLDVVRKSAFTDGQPVPLVWSHDWSKPIGKGIVRLTDRHAEFDGAFFTDTASGMDAYRTVKAMGELQEFSFGFEIKESRRIKYQDKDAREITKVTVFEVSTVLIGANRNTRTLAIKGGMRRSWDDQDEVLRAELADYLDRARTLVSGHAKEGRAISTNRRAGLEAMLASLLEHAESLQSLLEETAPRERDADGEAEKAARSALFAEYLALEARALGVQV
jgi:HK97 family phage prohead protease